MIWHWKQGHVCCVTVGSTIRFVGLVRVVYFASTQPFYCRTGFMGWDEWVCWAQQQCPLPFLPMTTNSLCYWHALVNWLPDIWNRIKYNRFPALRTIHNHIYKTLCHVSHTDLGWHLCNLSTSLQPTKMIVIISWLRWKEIHFKTNLIHIIVCGCRYDL